MKSINSRDQAKQEEDQKSEAEVPPAIVDSSPMTQGGEVGVSLVES
jgi:hypothetical protein